MRIYYNRDNQIFYFVEEGKGFFYSRLDRVWIASLYSLQTMEARDYFEFVCEVSDEQ